MLYFKINDRLDVVEISNGYPEEAKKSAQVWAMRADGGLGAGWLNRNDISQNASPMLMAQQIADSASKLSGAAYLAIDGGECVSPRYDVIKAPAVGDEVSKAFNGDYYPVGKIVAIGKEFKRIRVEGECGVLIFFRRKLSGCWKYKGMWNLVGGSVSRWNPEF